MNRILSCGVIAALMNVGLMAQEQAPEAPKPPTEIEQLRAQVAQAERALDAFRKERRQLQYRLGEALIEAAVCGDRLQQVSAPTPRMPPPSAPAAAAKP